MTENKFKKNKNKNKKDINQVLDNILIDESTRKNQIKTIISVYNSNNVTMNKKEESNKSVNTLQSSSSLNQYNSEKRNIKLILIEELSSLLSNRENCECQIIKLQNILSLKERNIENLNELKRKIKDESSAEAELGLRMVDCHGQENSNTNYNKIEKIGFNISCHDEKNDNNFDLEMEVEMETEEERLLKELNELKEKQINEKIELIKRLSKEREVSIQNIKNKLDNEENDIKIENSEIIMSLKENIHYLNSQIKGKICINDHQNIVSNLEINYKNQKYSILKSIYKLNEYADVKYNSILKNEEKISHFRKGSSSILSNLVQRKNISISNVSVNKNNTDSSLVNKSNASCKSKSLKENFKKGSINNNDNYVSNSTIAEAQDIKINAYKFMNDNI